MRKFWFSPGIVGPAIIFLLGVAVEIGGWVNPIVAYVLFGIAGVWALCTLVYWQRSKGRRQLEILKISYRCQKWQFPNPNLPNEDIKRMVKIGIDYNPSQKMQIAKISIKTDNVLKEAWGQHQFDIDKPEYHESWFSLPDIPAGIKKAKLVVLANNKLWESDEFDLNVPLASSVKLEAL